MQATVAQDYTEGVQAQPQIGTYAHNPAENERSNLSSPAGSPPGLTSRSSTPTSDYIDDLPRDYNPLDDNFDD